MFFSSLECSPSHLRMVCFYDPLISVNPPPGINNGHIIVLRCPFRLSAFFPRDPTSSLPAVQIIYSGVTFRFDQLPVNIDRCSLVWTSRLNRSVTWNYHCKKHQIILYWWTSIYRIYRYVQTSTLPRLWAAIQLERWAWKPGAMFDLEFVLSL